MKKMTMRLLCIWLLLSVCMGMLSGCTADGIFGEGAFSKPGSDADVIPGAGNILKAFTDRTIQNAEDALAAIEDVSTATGISDVPGTLGEAQQFSVLDSTFYRFAQQYKGIPVYGRAVTVGASSEGTGEGLSHNYLPISDVDTTPKISEEKARRIVAKEYGEQAQITSCNLTIYSLFDTEPTLTWQAEVFGPGILCTCFVDARTGLIITELSGIFTESAVGTYTDDYGTIDFLTEKNEDGTYALVDEKRNIEVYDAKHQTAAYALLDDAGNIYQYNKDHEKWYDVNGVEVVVKDVVNANGTWEVYDQSGKPIGHNAMLFPCVGKPPVILSVLTNATTAWDNKNAAAAMSLTEDVYDFYQTVLGRTGFNGTNGKVRITVNDDKNGDSTNAYSAFGDTRVVTCLFFGHARAITADVVAHEYTHSVEQSISNLAYKKEPGAIAEGLSDIFGELFEDWVVDGRLNDSCDWECLDRNMVDPAAKRWKTSQSSRKSYPYPTVYKGEGYCEKSYDNYGVHANSTVISHAAYCMTHPNDSSLDALTNEELAKVLYHAFSYMPSDCSFEAFASAVCLSAEVLKLPESKQDCIVRAFANAGIQADNIMLVPITNPSVDYLVTETSQWNVFGKNGELCDNYTLSVSGKRPLENGSAEEADPTATHYQVTTKEPLTLTLASGYMYTFVFADGSDPGITVTCQVGVHGDAPDRMDIIDLQTPFGKTIATPTSGLMLLTESPSADRPEQFSYKAYDLEGYVYESSGGGYSIETILPGNLKEIASFEGDFTHSGRSIDFTVCKEWEQSSGSDILRLRIEGVMTAGLRDLSLYSEKESYYYIVDGADAAYLVCESVTYDPFAPDHGDYYYKTGPKTCKEIVETITVINMANYDRYSISVEYNTESRSAAYREKTEVFMEPSKTNNLFYVGYTNEGRFSDYADLVAYIKKALAPYGLSDRVMSDVSTLTNFTPVYSAKTVGEPKTGTVNNSEEARLQGKAIIGFPVYTGTWFPDGVVKDPSKEDSKDSMTSAWYEDFLSDRGYLSDWKRLDLPSFYTLDSYGLIDIDQDGTQELIVTGDSDMGFTAFLVYAFDKTSGEVVRLPVDRSEIERNLITCYGELRYSPKYKALVFSETMPSSMYDGVEYFAISGDRMPSIGAVGADSFLAEGKMTYYTTINGGFKEITEAQWNGYLEELTWINYRPLP